MQLASYLNNLTYTQRHKKRNAFEQCCKILRNDKKPTLNEYFFVNFVHFTATAVCGILGNFYTISCRPYNENALPYAAL